MRINQTELGNANYLIEYAVSLNPAGVRQATTSNYNTSSGLIAADKDLVTYLQNRFAEGQDISKAFENVAVDRTTENGKDVPEYPIAGSTGKEFGETYVGNVVNSLLEALLNGTTTNYYGDQGNGSTGGNASNGAPTNVSTILIIGGCVLGGLIIIGGVIYWLVRPKKSA